VVSDLEGFDPNDIAELSAMAERIVKDSNTYYEVRMLVTHEGAEDFIEAFNASLDGNFMAMIPLMNVLHLIGTSLAESMDGDDEDN